MRNRKHNGTARRIRRELAESREPMSASAIAFATGIPIEYVRRSIQDMVSVTGGVVATRGEKGVTRYTLYQAPPAETQPVAGEEFRLAGKITIGRGSKWGAGLA